MGTYMTSNRMEAYVEVIEILKHMDKQYVEKVPLKLRDFFESNCSKEYKFDVDLSIPLNEQKLKEKTLDILAMLNINFWCESEEHKKELISLYSENDRKYQEKLRGKYNLENIFQSKNTLEKITENEQEAALINVCSVPWYKKIFNKIKDFFSRCK